MCVFLFMKSVTCLDLDRKLHEFPLNKLRWRPSVYAIVIQDGKILLSPQFDWYDLPGWGIELWESIPDALIREVHEETGFNVEPQSLVHVDSNFFVHPNHPEDPVQSILIYYTARVVSWELSTNWFDAEEKIYTRLAEWIPISELENIKWMSSFEVYPIVKKAISYS